MIWGRLLPLPPSILPAPLICNDDLYDVSKYGAAWGDQPSSLCLPYILDILPHGPVVLPPFSFEVCSRRHKSHCFCLHPDCSLTGDCATNIFSVLRYHGLFVQQTQKIY